MGRRPRWLGQGRSDHLQDGESTVSPLDDSAASRPVELILHRDKVLVMSSKCSCTNKAPVFCLWVSTFPPKVFPPKVCRLNPGDGLKPSRLNPCGWFEAKPSRALKMTREAELGEKVVILLDATLSLPSALPGTSSLTAVVSGINLPLESVGWNAADAPLQLINFVATDGTAKVSVIVPSQTVPRTVAIHVAHLIFEYILQAAPVEFPGFSVIVGGVVPIPGSSQGNGGEIMHEGTRLDGSAIQVAELNCCTESSLGIFGKLQRLPPGIQLRDEFLASLVHVARVMKLPTALLLGSTSLERRAQEKVESSIRTILAQHLGISFNPPKSVEESGRASSNIEEWQTLYS